jgi:hypothetical protein
MSNSRKEIIRTIYLYLFSLIGLVLIIIGCVNLVNLGLKSFVFKQADEIIIYPRQSINLETQEEISEEKIIQAQEEELAYRTQELVSRKQRSAANAVAMIIVGLPLYLYHWKSVQSTKEKD